MVTTGGKDLHTVAATYSNSPSPSVPLPQRWDCISQLQEAIWTWDRPCLPSIWYCSVATDCICVLLFAAADHHMPGPRAGTTMCITLMSVLLLSRGEKRECIPAQLCSPQADRGKGMAQREGAGGMNKALVFSLRQMPKAVVGGRKGGTVPGNKHRAQSSA